MRPRECFRQCEQRGSFLNEGQDTTTPQDDTPDPARVVIPRRIAGGLALGATLWALFCLPLFCGALLDLNLRGVLILGSGYLVTAAYYWRAFGRPSPRWARAIWSYSCLVQGTWLAVVLVSSGPKNLRFFDGIALTWWTGAALLSLLALCIEPDQSRAP